MTQSAFMYELMVACESFSDEQKYNIMNDCNQFFFDKKEAGLSEEEIISALPEPKRIAQSYKAGETSVFKDSEAETDETGATPLGVFLFVLLIPLCGVYEVLVFVLGLIACVALLAVCIAAAFLSVASFGVSTLSHGFVLVGIGGLFGTVALVLFSAAFFRMIAAAFRWFPSYMGRLLKREKGGRKA